MNNCNFVNIDAKNLQKLQELYNIKIIISVKIDFCINFVSDIMSDIKQSHINADQQALFLECFGNFQTVSDEKIAEAKRIFRELARIPIPVGMHPPVQVTGDRSSAERPILFKFAVGRLEYFMKLEGNVVTVSPFSRELDTEYLLGSLLLPRK